MVCTSFSLLVVAHIVLIYGYHNNIASVRSHTNTMHSCQLHSVGRRSPFTLHSSTLFYGYQPPPPNIWRRLCTTAVARRTFSLFHSLSIVVSLCTRSCSVPHTKHIALRRTTHTHTNGDGDGVLGPHNTTSLLRL